LQTTSNLYSGGWVNVVEGISTNAANIIYTNSLNNNVAYYRLQSQ
jgi:hypothetical protein